ncbi:MAG TPA: M20/M25/M40 family metallo-hydrolase [Blastocatellia bacterium]|nr:M20/M25/M40 family metallo-hydrolase [Blastocatellia bacterium]
MTKRMAGLLLIFLLGGWGAAAPEPTPSPSAVRINPVIKQIVDSVSEERIAAILKKLESFETRNTLSDPTHPTRGIGAARSWIFEQFKSYSPRLQVRYDTYMVKKQGERIVRDVELRNVVAVLPGTTQPQRQIIISAHYDSLAIVRRDGQVDWSQTEVFAPGVTDDGSGTAAVMELARVLSQYEFEKTLVFIAFAGEEQGLVGSTLYAQKARRENHQIEAVLNNDIIGSDVTGSGARDNRSVRIFSEEPSDSLSRQLARYVKRIGEAYVPSMRVDLIFRHDRFGRGGDHTPFNHQGYAAVRFTTPNENYANQHTATDTFENCSPAYTALVTKVNAAVAASLALAPKPPIVTNERGAPLIGRGRSGYAAHLRWRNDAPEADLAGYAIVIRATTAPDWEREIFVGNVTEYVLEDVSIDAFTFGVKAIDRDGNESLVSAYVNPPRPPSRIEIIESERKP